jgi:hypothetical protein
MSFEKEILALVEIRLAEALNKLVKKIKENLSEEVSEEIGEIDVSSFVKTSVKKVTSDLSDVFEEIVSSKASKEKTSTKAKKDKNSPKGARNAYIIFSSENRAQVVEENPEMKSTEIVQELARLWKEADDETKSEYQEKAASDKERFAQEMEEYNSGDESPKKSKSAKSKKECKYQGM